MAMVVTDEMRKVITAVALAGDRLVLIDNVVNVFGGASLDAAFVLPIAASGPREIRCGCVARAQKPGSQRRRGFRRLAAHEL